MDNAAVAELVDALDLGSSRLSLWRFDPSPRYKANERSFAFLLIAHLLNSGFIPFSMPADEVYQSEMGVYSNDIYSSEPECIQLRDLWIKQ